MYIEDLIHYATRSGPYLFTKQPMPVTVTGQDLVVLQSLSDQLEYNNNHLTERQGLLAIRLLGKYRAEFRPHLATVDNDLDNPQWKHPFRVLPKHKRITIAKHSQPAKFHNGDCILVEFPFENDIVDSFRRRNSEVHDLHKGGWDSDLKQWVFACTEVNIEWLGSTLLPREFQADEKFLELYKEVSDVLLDMENNIPMIIQNGDRIEFKNTHKNIPQSQTTNLAEALFLAREYGVTVWDDDIDKRIDNQLHPVTKTILSSTNRKQHWVSSNIHDVYTFTDLINYGGPALVVVPGGSELALVKEWAEFARNIGIKTEEMSVMFRLPNEQSAFNQFVKERELNGPVTENTRLVFVSTKITKPLIKAGIKFNTVINLGYYNYMHFSMSTIVDNARNLVYYSMKQPTKNNKWLPQEL